MSDLTEALEGAGLGGLAQKLSAKGHDTLAGLGHDEAEVERTVLDAAPETDEAAVDQLIELWKSIPNGGAPDNATTGSIGTENPDGGGDGSRDASSAGADSSTAEKREPTATEGGKLKAPAKEGDKPEPATSGGGDKAKAPTGTAKGGETKLPAGTKIDLTQATATVGDLSFTLPTYLSTNKSGGTFKDATELQPDEWMTIAKRTQLTRCIDMGKALQTGEPEEALAPLPALDWVVGDDVNFIVAGRKAASYSSLCYTSSLQNLVRNRIMEGGLEIETPFVGVAASASRNEKAARSALRKRLYMTGIWRYRFVKLDLTKCTTLADRFLSALKDGLDKPKPFEALQNVFSQYGQVMPRYVELGGQIQFEQERVMSGDVEESTVTDVVTAAVKGKAGASSGTLTASFQDASGSKIDSQRIMDSARFRCVGGDTTLDSNPKDWAGTTKDPNSWDVLARSELIGLVDRIVDEALKNRVKEVWRAGLRELWGTNPPARYVLPDMEGRPFTITEDSSGQLLAPSPVPHALAPLAPANIRSEALLNGAGWLLEYTGHTSDGGRGRGLPIYWLKEYQDEVLRDERKKDITAAKKVNAKLAESGLAPARGVPALRVALSAVQRGSRWYASSEDVADTEAVAVERHPAAWTLQPVSNFDRPGQSYVLQHWVSQKVLGSVKDDSEPFADGSSTPYVELADPPADLSTAPAWRLLDQEPK